jgi:hypothetical protein
LVLFGMQNMVAIRQPIIGSSFQKRSGARSADGLQRGFDANTIGGRPAQMGLSRSWFLRRDFELAGFFCALHLGQVWWHGAFGDGGRVWGERTLHADTTPGRGLLGTAAASGKRTRRESVQSV